MTLDVKSTKFLERVHPDLVRVVERACEITPFRVTEGLRTLARQKQLKAQGKSRTLNSRHLTGHAVDLVDPAGSYDDAKMRAISVAMKQAAEELGVPLTWGGDWTKFCDTPHFELEWHAYPAGTFKAKAKAAVAGGAGVGGVASIPAVPTGVSGGLARIEEYTAIGSRIGALFKGVWTLQPVSVAAVIGVLMMIGFALWPKGGTHDTGGSD